MSCWSTHLRMLLAKARDKISGWFDAWVERGKLSREQADASLANLKTAQDFSDEAQNASLLVETATEQLAIKHSIIAKAESCLAKDAIIATNTSALIVTEIAAACVDPTRVIGMHFFNPVQKMKLVELVRGWPPPTRLWPLVGTIVAQLGKTTIVVNETPGLTTSRMSAMAGNEAMWMLQEGAATAEDIDTALRLGFNHPMGPLELGDLTGWDTRLSVLHYLHATLGDKFQAVPADHQDGQIGSPWNQDG